MSWPVIVHMMSVMPSMPPCVDYQDHLQLAYVYTQDQIMLVYLQESLPVWLVAFQYAIFYQVVQVQYDVSQSIGRFFQWLYRRWRDWCL